VGVDEMDALTYEVGRDLSHGELLIASGPGRHMEFFWMSGAGVLHTSLLPSPTPPYSILSPPVVLPYPPSPSPPLFVSPTSVSQGATTSAVQSAPMVHRSNTGATDAELKLLPVPPPAPKSMALTNHHLLMLYDERLLVVSRITFERVIALCGLMDGWMCVCVGDGTCIACAEVRDAEAAAQGRL